MGLLVDVMDSNFINGWNCLKFRCREPGSEIVMSFLVDIKEFLSSLMASF